MKQSFVDYVQGVGGAVSFGSPASWHEGAFHFPAIPGRKLRFEGEVGFFAHGGLLSIELADPWVEENGGMLTLSVADFARSHRLQLAVLDCSDGWRRGAPMVARITEAGSFLFGGNYPVGTVLDPVVVVIVP